MKPLEFVFKRPVQVLQVFRNVVRYEKDQKAFEERTPLMQWQSISSKSGWVTGDKLFLPDSISSQVDLPGCDLITIEDDNPPGSIASMATMRREFTERYWPKSAVLNRCLNLRHRREFDIFYIDRTADGFSLSLKYNYLEIGVPKREEFPVAVLKKDYPVEFMINGKTDSSSSWHRERTFIEQHYVFCLLGSFERCWLMSDPYDGMQKQVPASRKVISMMKPLW